MTSTNAVWAGLFVLPVWALARAVRRKKYSGAIPLSLALALLLVAVQGIGCGGHFTPASTVAGGVTPPGLYYVQVNTVATSGPTQGQIYQAIVPVTISR